MITGTTYGGGHVTMTVLARPVLEVADEAIASNAFPMTGDTRLTTFRTFPQRGTIAHELTRRDVRVIRERHSAAPASVTGGGRPTTQSHDVSVGPWATGLRDTEIARIDEMISRSDIVKLSDEDLSWIRAGDRHGDAIRWLMSRGPAILVLTHGDGTVTGYTRSGSAHVRGHRSQVANAAEWEEAFVHGLLDALIARGLLAHGSGRSLRTIGLADLRGILHDANLSATRAATLATEWPPRTATAVAAEVLTKSR